MSIHTRRVAVAKMFLGAATGGGVGANLEEYGPKFNVRLGYRQRGVSIVAMSQPRLSGNRLDIGLQEMVRDREVRSSLRGRLRWLGAILTKRYRDIPDALPAKYVLLRIRKEVWFGIWYSWDRVPCGSQIDGLAGGPWKRGDLHWGWGWLKMQKL
jgi:hypothetical protein